MTLRIATLTATILTLLLAGPALAQDKAGLRCASSDGALLYQDKAGKWHALSAKDVAPSARPIVSLFSAELRSTGDGVAVKMIGDVAERGMFPVLESAVVVHPKGDCDVDLALERGIIVVSNLKKSGAAKVRIRVMSETFDVTLPDAKARLGVERYARHVPGLPNLTDPKKDRPVTSAFFFALSGEVLVEHASKSSRLSAPPGTALLHWDDSTNVVETKFYDQLPELAKPISPDEKKRQDAINGQARQLAQQSATIGKALDATIGDPLARKVAITTMGALDDLPRLLAALDNPKDPAGRDFVITVLRHWLGREPGQSIELDKHLTKLGYSRIQAKTLLYLINGIEHSKRLQPGTYEVLIHSLNHSKLPVRELARWHLTRLAPIGNKIAYDAGGSEEQRTRAIEQWRALIPAGELPKAPQ